MVRFLKNFLKKLLGKRVYVKVFFSGHHRRRQQQRRRLLHPHHHPNAGLGGDSNEGAGNCNKRQFPQKCTINVIKKSLFQHSGIETQAGFLVMSLKQFCFFVPKKHSLVTFPGLLHAGDAPLQIRRQKGNFFRTHTSNSSKYADYLYFTFQIDRSTRFEARPRTTATASS